MIKSRGARWIVFLALLIFFGFVLADSLGIFNTGEYDEIPHGDHVHYVPHDRDPNISISNFPTQLPPPGQRIASDGRVLPAN